MGDSPNVVYVVHAVGDKHIVVHPVVYSNIEAVVAFCNEKNAEQSSYRWQFTQAELLK